jgi:hypothetical protein
MNTIKYLKYCDLSRFLTDICNDDTDLESGAFCIGTDDKLVAANPGATRRDGYIILFQEENRRRVL